MKKQLWVLLVLLVAILSACAAQYPTEPSTIPQENNNSESEPITISASRAREIAVEAIGGGNVQGIETVTSGESMQFSVQVDYNGNVYNVILDAETGNFISLSLVGQPQEQESIYDEPVPTPHPQTGEAIIMPDTITPEAHGRTDVPENPEISSPATQASPLPQASPSPSPDRTQGNRPANPAISLERAIEIGYAEIAERGHTGSFRSDSGMDWERGQWVWELLFSVEGGRLPLVEMYISVDTGEIVKFEWDD